MSFSFGERLGLLFTVQASVVTATCNTGILVYVVFKRVRRARQNNYVVPDATDSSLFINLMVADLVQAMGNLPSIRWISDAGVTEGTLCTAQAVLKQLGSDTVAFTCLAISFQTFCTLIFRWRFRKITSKFIILGIWISTGLIVAINYAAHGKDPLYGPTNYFCWVLPTHRAEQIMSEYLYIWCTAIIMTILYGAMFFILRPDSDSSESPEDREAKKVANMLLYYPAVYIVCVGPLSITRWMYFLGHDISYQVALFATTLYALIGLFNLALFSITRPALISGESQPAELASDIPPRPHHRHEQESSRRVHRGNYGHLPSRSSGLDVEQGRPTGVDPEKLANSSTSSPVSTPGGLVPRLGSANTGSGRTDWTHDDLNHHSRVPSSSQAEHEPVAPEDRDRGLRYTSPIDEAEDHGFLPGQRGLQ